MQNTLRQNSVVQTTSKLAGATKAVNRLLGLFIGVAAGCVLVQAIILFWYGFSINVSLADSSISITLLCAACLLTGNNLKYYRPEKGRYWYIFTWCFILAVIWMLLNNWILDMLLDASDKTYSDFLFKSIPVRFFIALLVIGLIATISVLWYTQEDQKEMEQRKADAEKLARDAELYNLRQQLQPHFLFNSLNSITALIGGRPEEARKMIHQLSDFLRGTLKKEDQQPVSLNEELDHLRLYLDIEKVRFGHRLQTIIEVSEQIKTMMLPPMLLQPLVENAIKFGLYDTIGEVTITISAASLDQELIIQVQNPYDQITSKPKKGTGFGLAGVKRRLHLLFGRTDLLETQADSHIFTTTVKIPQL